MGRVVVGIAMFAFAVLNSPGIHAGALNPAPVARTGQTVSYASGDDGDLQQGVSWPDPRFTDNQDGTVTDHLTGLVWLKDATRFTSRGWNAALTACNNLADDGLDLTDGSVAGDWRLPNNMELRSLLDLGRSDPALPAGHPFLLPGGAIFWASTTATNNTARAWTIDDGTMVNDPKRTANLVWPVRDGDSGETPAAPVRRTGQTVAYGSRDDGELQKGVEWPVARFTDNQDGTVTDNLTGLIWLQDATRFQDLSFPDALMACNTLAEDGAALTDSSMAGDWRLPNLRELSSLNDFSQIGPALPTGHPFLSPNAGVFWTATTAAGESSHAWAVGLGIGKVTSLPKDSINQVWPVRGGLPVPVEVKPGGCPSPLQVASRGLLPVAILGTPDRNVTAIDPATIRLEGVAPVRFSLEDVATSLPPYRSRESCDCDEAVEAPDGWVDLTLKFRTQEIVAALGDAGDRECRPLLLTGNLRVELGGTPIEGTGSVLMLGKD
jgi:hypothetical protein